ncbi:alpha/beta hydrolase [Neorhizobium galegae]|uniref:alpha/beta hydrolase n=1 Tax=Neorhizobium galegae TaxID=399 RepID=UPI000622144A|nr:alpha/beta hydrolase [Neorhizobium galegae]CDZ26456.1 Esterase/lipase/thioesterase, active site [Neorhizobium galegae bv. officinalis]KAA9385824.1 alpha/beta fold hydrolase [Neorhizobium galegae]KAB1112595.1 alpha/beta hydrolase [Neorhizobium galegae]MCM2497895.1 alpha/beta hydrolase [Neorhizobium galegae]MCQ1764006.1 alpha/beta hydrolase [Neorhizobium galegae]
MESRAGFSFRVIAVVTVLSVLAGCAGRPEGVLIPTNSQAAGTSKVDVLVATTRRSSQTPGVLFSGERGKEPVVTEIAVSIPPDKAREVGQVQWPSKLPANPAKEFATVSVTPLATPAAQSWLKGHLGKSRRVLVFVHGFNNRYEDAVYRFAQIVHDSNADVAPVLFTWPSRGSVFAYNYDKESTNYSRDALEEMLRRLAKEPNVGEITVMAHSMGSWLTVEALRQMAIRDGRVAPKIQNVILASPDLDVDVFGQQLAEIGEKRPHFTLFVSRDDRALSLSRRISGNIDRLGQVDPTVEPYRSEFEKAGIAVLDLTALKTGDRLNHGKFAESPEVVKLIGNRLIAGQAVSDSDVGLGDRLGAVALGAAQTVGGAASVAVSTPIAIFDPATRRTYNDQVDRLGNAVGNTVTTAVGQ